VREGRPLVALTDGGPPTLTVEEAEEGVEEARPRQLADAWEYCSNGRRW
jgi:hypothetical protein